MSSEQSLSDYVDENSDQIRRVIRHSDNEYARACAWALLDAGGDGPEIERLRDELNELKGPA